MYKSRQDDAILHVISRNLTRQQLMHNECDLLEFVRTSNCMKFSTLLVNFQFFIMIQLYFVVEFYSIVNDDVICFGKSREAKVT